MEPIEDYLFHSLRSNVITETNIKFTSIPSDFKIVIKKMIPEITGIRTICVESMRTYDPLGFESVVRFRVKIALMFGGGKSSIKGIREHYSDEINKLFNYAYCEYDFIKFYVHEFDFPPVKTNYDKFVELFGGE